jgi:tetratricopeptide (TPR) repeat protein
MKKLIFVLILIASYGFAEAQKSKVVSAYNYAKPKYNQLDKAMKAIDEAKEHPSTAQDAKTWFYRGTIYQQIFQDSTFSHLHPNPINEAIFSFMKSLEYDEKGRYKKDVINNLNTALSQALINGVNAIQNQKYDIALENFDMLIKASKLETTLDLAEVCLRVYKQEGNRIYFLAGFAAQQKGDIELSNKYFKEAAEVGYEVSKVYLQIAANYKQLGDMEGYVNILKEGMSKTQDNKYIRLQLIDYYSSEKKLDEALVFMKEAVEKDPENVTLYFALGNVYSELDKEKEALEAYDKAIAIDPNNVDVLFNLGTLYFNNGAELKNEANQLPYGDKKYDPLMAEALIAFEQASKYFEKAHKLEPKAKDILETLKKLYMQLRNVKDKEKQEQFSKRMSEVDELLKQL